MVMLPSLKKASLVGIYIDTKRLVINDPARDISRGVPYEVYLVDAGKGFSIQPIIASTSDVGIPLSKEFLLELSKRYNEGYIKHDSDWVKVVAKSHKPPEFTFVESGNSSVDITMKLKFTKLLFSITKIAYYMLLLLLGVVMYNAIGYLIKIIGELWRPF